MTIHCTPVEESERSFCRLGTAIATIVMSMKVIATAKIIAARIRFFFGEVGGVHGERFAVRRPNPARSIVSRRLCLTYFGLGPFSSPFFLIGVFAGARSRSASVATGAAIGAYIGVMLAFPLLAIGLATS